MYCLLDLTHKRGHIHRREQTGQKEKIAPDNVCSLNVLYITGLRGS